jgi:hypothetical protein
MDTYPEEYCARALHAELSRALAVKNPRANLSISGFGCHWQCQVTCGERQCTIHCFSEQTEAPGGEFLARFDELPPQPPRQPFWGRTWEPADVVSAACAWVEKQSVEAMYTQFSFVEATRRALEGIAREVLKSEPNLAQSVRPEVISWDAEDDDACTLSFRCNDRSCAVGFYGYEKVPDCSFPWDGSLQFTIKSSDTALLSKLLRRWLCEQAMSSVMKSEFPSIDLTGVALYYEQGRGVEGEFIESWRHVEGFYKKIDSPYACEVLKLLQQMRAAGHDRTLRAGTSLFTLLLSRSRRHGLRDNQPHIAFSFGGARFNERQIAAGTMEIEVCLDTNKSRTAFPSIELNPTLELLLKELEQREID